jgi:hypothetical protein
MTLDELKAMIEAEALRRQAARDGFTLEAVESFLGKGVVAPPELVAPVPPAPEPPTLAYFNALHGENLVNACYTVLLGRAPDAAGMQHFMQQLASGADKALVVGSIAYSAEARARGVRVPGLAPRFAVAMASRVPLLGRLAEWGLALLTMGARARHARALEHHFNQRLDALARYTAQSSAQVALRIESLRSVMTAKD